MASRNCGTLGIDIGTSGCKALLLDETGTVLGASVETYGLTRPKVAWAEQEPSDWIRAAKKSVKELKQRFPHFKVVCIGLTGQMHGLTAIGADHRPIRPAILWNDQRSAEQCQKATEQLGGLPAVISLINNPILAGYTVGKILWMRDYECSLFDQIKWILNPKDYLSV